MRLLFLLLGCCAALAAHADIYKSVDASGRVTYTDQPVRGARRLNLGPLPAPVFRAGTSSAEHKISTRKKNPSDPGGFPRVDAKTQNKRDALRRNILQSELRTEEQSLADAAVAKTDGEKLNSGEQASSPGYLARLKKLDDAIKLHRDNIKALGKELGSLK
ncbi:MAG: DUF4124 domain-containing protein [Sulfuriferula sp.]